MKIVRSLYDWVLHWADTPYGVVALFLLAFSESSFFPVPPDVLLIALSISKPGKAIFYALITTIGSILGGMLGYTIGEFGFESIGQPIIEWYGAMDSYHRVRVLFEQYDAWAIGIAGFTPIPYKVFTISAGAFKINFWVFLAASAVSRAARFFLVGGLIRIFGNKIREYIDRYFNLFTIIFVILLVLGFVVVRYLVK
ncbi:MAG: YqaA family protein [Candidatus Glassbacteria bacterium]